MFQNQPVPRAEVSVTTNHLAVFSTCEGTHVVGEISLRPGPYKEIKYFTKDQTGRISDAAYDVIEACLDLKTLSPTNPSVLLMAAREWYLAHGGRNLVLSILVEHLCELEGLSTDYFGSHEEAMKLFKEKTSVSGT